jgi:hypothetical protein
MFHTGARIPGNHPRLEGGGDTSRVMKIGSVTDANGAKADIERIVRAWCEWRAGEATDVAKSKKKRPGTAATRKKAAATGAARTSKARPRIPRKAVR